MLKRLLFISLISGGFSSGAQIADNYPGDDSIHLDPNVIFAEMFEESKVTDLTSSGKWNQMTNIPANILWDSSVPLGSTGKQSLRLITINDADLTNTGTNENTFLYKRIQPDITDSVYFRFYIKYDKLTSYHHSGGYVGGKNPASNVAGVQAGVAPAGNKEFHIGTEIRGAANIAPAAISTYGFYNYWMGMHPNSSNVYYGNEFIDNTTNDDIAMDQWTCIEIKVKLNNPVNVSNGELTMWVNGIKITDYGYQFPNGTWNQMQFTNGAGSPFEGFQWRSDAALNINYIWLKSFVTNNADQHQGNVYFDHVVVAKKYIGPIAPMITSVGNVTQNSTFSIFPNPAQNELNFSEAISDFSILNAYGQLFIYFPEKVKSISLATLSDGIYFISKGNAHQKIIVQH